MKQFLGATFVTALALGFGGPVHADEKDATAVVDKAIKALGGEEKLSRANAITWKAKGKLNIAGLERDLAIQVTVQGLDHYRQVVETQRGEQKTRGVAILAGDKGWEQFDSTIMELDKSGLANQRRAAYLHLIPITVVQLKDKGFKMETAGEEKVGGKPAVALKITGPDGKDFMLFFDRESGLPVKLVAVIPGIVFGKKEVTRETTFGRYKELSGIMKATTIASKCDYYGQFDEVEIVEFQILDKADPKTFDEPK